MAKSLVTGEGVNHFVVLKDPTHAIFFSKIGFLPQTLKKKISYKKSGKNDFEKK